VLDCKPLSVFKALTRRTQPITDSSLRQDELRPLRVFFNFLPELPHVYAQILSVGQVIPQFPKQEFVREHFARMLNQQAQQVVFLGRELDLVIADLDDPSHEIDRKIARLKNRPLACVCI